MSLTAPYAPPPVPERRRRGGVIGPLVLIFIGAVFLLENTGYLPPNFWMNLWRLWPLVLVLVGIELLLAHRVPWLALAGLAAVVLVLGAVATKSNMPSPVPAPTTSTSTQTDLGGASQATVTVRFGAGQLNVGAIEQPQPTVLANMTYDGPVKLYGIRNVDQMTVDGEVRPPLATDSTRWRRVIFQGRRARHFSDQTTCWFRSDS